MEYFYEKYLINYEHYSNKQLKELWLSEKDENARIVLAKRNHNIKGDVFIHRGNIYNLERYLALNVNSTATTIEEAGAEYLVQLEIQAQSEAQEV